MAEQRAATPTPGSAHLVMRLDSRGTQVGVEYLSGRWPSLVLEGSGMTAQIDLADDLSGPEIRRTVAALATAAVQWFDEVLGTGGSRI